MANFVMEGTGTVCILSGRTYTKVNSGFAVVGMYNKSDNYTGPLLVSTVANSVVYNTSSGGGPWSYMTTITHGGKTWYVSEDEYFWTGTPADTSGLDRYMCSSRTAAAAAEELLTAYEASLVPEVYIPSAGQIADYTGTEYHQINKLYEFGGSAFSQIARVYDWNGTASALIYSAELVLPDASASGGDYHTGNNTNVITSSTVWNIAGFNSLTLTWRNDMSVNFWTNPQGSVSNRTRYCYLVFADGTELQVGTGTDQQTTTVDLSNYTDAQKTSVRLRGKLDYYLSTSTNAACYGGISATNVIAT